MRDSVKDAFQGFSEGFEGKVAWMYLDILGLVTTGIGNLIDSSPRGVDIPEAQWVMPNSVLQLQMVRKDTGEPASDSDLAAEWRAVKRTGSAGAHNGFRYLDARTQLRLTDDGLSELVAGKRDEMWKYLESHYPDINDWPADAQLATMSMAWACGPAFHGSFRNLERALLAQDFAAAAGSCHMNDTHNPGLVPRNVATKKLYELAARVVSEGLDADALLYGSDAAG